jgi:hypothetical protein
VAMGEETGMVSMYVNEKNLASAFILQDGAEAADIPMAPLDSIVSKLSPGHVDFIKIDVEGFELSVLSGGTETLQRYSPIVMLEMNHWCLNVFRRMSLPDFRDALLEIFPYIYAVDGGTFLDFTQSKSAGEIYHEHVIGRRFNNLVAGFDNAKLVEKLSKWQASSPAPSASVQADAVSQREMQESDAERRLNAILASSSWKLTAPIRLCGRLARALLR